MVRPGARTCPPQCPNRRPLSSAASAQKHCRSRPGPPNTTSAKAAACVSTRAYASRPLRTPHTGLHQDRKCRQCFRDRGRRKQRGGLIALAVRASAARSPGPRCSPHQRCCHGRTPIPCPLPTHVYTHPQTAKAHRSCRPRSPAVRQQRHSQPAPCAAPLPNTNAYTQAGPPLPRPPQPPAVRQQRQPDLCATAHPNTPRCPKTARRPPLPRTRNRPLCARSATTR